MSMSNPNLLILKPGLDHTFPEFNSKIKFTAVMEEVLYTLLSFFFLSGDSKFTNVVNDLIRVLGHTSKTTGSTLNSLDQLGLITYYQDSRYKTIELELENTFLKSVIARFFGITDFTKMKCKKLKRVLYGFYPIRDFEQTMSLFQSETKRLDLLIDEYNYLFDWVESIAELERLAKMTHSIDDPVDGNPILLFIDRIVSGMNFQQSIQSSDLSVQQIADIITEVVSEFEEIPPWSDAAVIGGYNPWVVLEEELE